MQEAEQPAGESPGPGWESRNARFGHLLLRARQGDAEAFALLYEASSRWLLSFVRRMVGEEHAEDVLADAYIQIWKSLAAYDEKRGVPAVWMAVIARSRALDHLRGERSAGRRIDAGVDVQHEASRDDGPEQLLTRSEEAQLVRLSVARLEPTERLVVGLAYYRECSCPEIARLTGMSMSAVKASMARAQEKLRLQFTGAHARAGERNATSASL